MVDANWPLPHSNGSNCGQKVARTTLQSGSVCRPWRSILPKHPTLFLQDHFSLQYTLAGLLQTTCLLNEGISYVSLYSTVIPHFQWPSLCLQCTCNANVTCLLVDSIMICHTWARYPTLSWGKGLVNLGVLLMHQLFSDVANWIHVDYNNETYGVI